MIRIITDSAADLTAAELTAPGVTVVPMTVTFADGGEQSKTYTLSTGRLRVEYSEDGRRTMLPQLAGDKESFVYGIYAVSETESRWLRWPVQDSRTVSLGNPYGTVNGKAEYPLKYPYPCAHIPAENTVLFLRIYCRVDLPDNI